MLYIFISPCCPIILLSYSLHTLPSPIYTTPHNIPPPPYPLFFSYLFCFFISLLHLPRVAIYFSCYHRCIPTSKLPLHQNSHLHLFIPFLPYHLLFSHPLPHHSSFSIITHLSHVIPTSPHSYHAQKKIQKTSIFLLFSHPSLDSLSLRTTPHWYPWTSLTSHNTLNPPPSLPTFPSYLQSFINLNCTLQFHFQQFTFSTNNRYFFHITFVIVVLCTCLHPPMMFGELLRWVTSWLRGSKNDKNVSKKLTQNGVRRALKSIKFTKFTKKLKHKFQKGVRNMIKNALKMMKKWWKKWLKNDLKYDLHKMKKRP